MDLTDDLWQRADALLDAALDLDEEERGSYLEAACGSDEELRALVERLLAKAEDKRSGIFPGGAMCGPVWEAAARLLAEGAQPPVEGRRVDRYRLLRELGRGGMAVVYLAERADGQFEQPVALKLVQGGLGTEEVIRRFHQERQILARIQRPHIAQLLDGGVTSDGQPYFAMERVEGRPIDVYCDEERLSVRQRVRLFLRVAQAVGHAHRNLVVHRDIKPSNILVSDDGNPKLLDFGIARLMGQGEEDVTLTRTEGRMMTPAYASPEQVRGDPVTTASDIHQLGLLLYVLLSSGWPYSSSTGSTPDMARVICEEKPTRPSTVLGRPRGHAPPSGAAPDLLALRRDRPPHRLSEVLLQRIYLGRCLTALERYPEAEALLLPTMAGDLDTATWRYGRAALMELYQAWGRPDEAVKQQALLEGLAVGRSRSRP